MTLLIPFPLVPDTASQRVPEDAELEVEDDELEELLELLWLYDEEADVPRPDPDPANDPEKSFFVSSARPVGYCGGGGGGMSNSSSRSSRSARVAGIFDVGCTLIICWLRL